MEGAALRLRDELSNTSFGEFSAPVVTNVEAEPMADSARVRNMLELQLTSPVRWVDVTRRLRAQGVSSVFEIGPGKVLTGLIKRIEKEMALYNLNEAADIDKVAAALQPQ